MAVFFQDSNANGSSDALVWQGGTGTFWTWGEFAGATLSLEASPDGENWFIVGSPGVFSEKTVSGFALGPCRLRVTIEGAGEETRISAVV
ncbi:hypothetical protein Plav_0547 [Parvibaculum lavamentivorans DS-1]|uniref:Uncharacterized protein n=1 Tax=Parvibaculum lavamentivorans (strain DS-1 / DSM 13023 / NCIMB 13966) TaxID=402881 RepID=A7HQI7_PARL1|nr:hypothetical protein [Parvibaculum lavamentivorans]ABS62170.1 hypothetical protein Plav_0547 [Parvibaculum lavamentivorans DS-1]